MTVSDAIAQALGQEYYLLATRQKRDYGTSLTLGHICTQARLNWTAIERKALRLSQERQRRDREHNIQHNVR